MSVNDAPAPIPVIQPEKFDDYAVFRETFLKFITDRATNSALRAFGEVQFDAFLECLHFWPKHAKSTGHANFRAVIADLRHLQGFLADEPDEDYAQVARRFSRELGEIADKLEREVSQPIPTSPE